MQGDRPLFGPTTNSQYFLVKRKTLQPDESMVQLHTNTMAIVFLNNIAHDFRNIETFRKVASELEGRVCSDTDKVLIKILARALADGHIRIIEIRKSAWGTS